jgi:dephospho-CoA kinase
MKRIAITGGIACGKSQVGMVLEAEGVPVCEADDIARGLLQPGEAVFREVVGSFGQEILTPDGEINRGILGRRVFADAIEREKLNRCVHPETRVRWTAWLKAQETPVAAVIIPLLYEIDDGGNWDAVMCVTASRGVQLERLAERGLDREEAGQRIAAQLDVTEKAKRADFVIANSGSRELLKEQTVRVLNSIRER